MQENRKTTSLQLKLIAVVIAVLLTGQVVSGLVFYNNARNRLETDLVAESRNLPNRLSISLEESVWNLNKEQASLILLSEMSKKEIVAILVYDKDKNIFSALGRDRNGKAAGITQKPAAHDLMPWSGDIKRQGETIGGIDVYLTRAYVNEELRTMSWYIAILTGGLIALIGGLLSGLLRGIVIQRIRSTSSMLKDIASGDADLTKRIGIRTFDEIGELGYWFNEIVGKLEEVFSKVKQTAIQVDSISREVVSGIGEISRVSQSQASSIEEIASTIEEMTSTIRHNSDNANEGRTESKHMEEIIGRGLVVVNNLLTAMNDISLSSHKIGDIITTVNEVAFQTNLLALNAAVEAARAGEHGKGFAVVADEVRSLAQRSAHASNEVRSLIEETVNKVRVGDEMVKKTADTFTDIQSTIVTLTQTMEEIATASTEQASGVDELNRAIALIDGTTQQNTGTVEQLAGVSENLKREADALSLQMSGFQVSSRA
jgi:methyl-accepting chemotaxis protein